MKKKYHSNVLTFLVIGLIIGFIWASFQIPSLLFMVAQGDNYVSLDIGKKFLKEWDQVSVVACKGTIS